jgi:hypothetical protein
MTYGFQTKNNNGQVLIDSDLFHYHFVEKLNHTSVSRVPELINGPMGSYDKAPNYPNSLDSDQGRGNIYKFIFASNGAKPPMCFIKPGSTGSAAPYAAVVLTKRVGTNWEIWVLQEYSTSVPAPILYCFSPLDQGSSPTTDAYGLQTFNAAGAPTFDSRREPLRVIDSQVTRSPNLANTGASNVGGNTDIDLSVNVTPRDYAINNAPTDSSDIIYYCPSIAHCCQDKRAQRSDDGFQAAGNNSYFYAWARNDLWWTYYRAAYRVGSGNKFQSSYAAYASGHVWATAEDTSSLLGAILAAALGAWTVALGLAIAASVFTDAGVASGSYYPYENDSKNEALDVPFILSRASYYD